LSGRIHDIVDFLDYKLTTISISTYCNRRNEQIIVRETIRRLPPEILILHQVAREDRAFRDFANRYQFDLAEKQIIKHSVAIEDNTNELLLCRLIEQVNHC
jgi:hypothetical protein